MIAYNACYFVHNFSVEFSTMARINWLSDRSIRLTKDPPTSATSVNNIEYLRMWIIYGKQSSHGSCAARCWCEVPSAHVHRTNKLIGSLYFWATVCIRPLSVCLSCPVCDVGALWPNDWTDKGETLHAGRPRPWPHCVRWGPRSPSQKGAQPPNFRTKSVAAKWLHGSKIKMSLGMELGLGPGDFVLDQSINQYSFIKAWQNACQQREKGEMRTIYK